MTRRGAIEMDTTVAIAIVVVATLIVGLLVVRAVSLVGGSQESVQCDFSVTVRELADRLGAGDVFKLSCPRRYVHVTDTDVKELYGEWLELIGQEDEYTYAYVDTTGAEPDVKYRSEVSRDPAGFEEDFKRIAAHEMAKCWNQFNQGSFDATGSASILAGKNSCIVCADIYLDRSHPPVSINMNTYLRNNRYPAKNLEGGDALDTTYHDYLYNAQTPSLSAACIDDAIGTSVMADVPLRGEEEYVVVLVRKGSGLGDAKELIDNVVHVTKDEDKSYFCQAVVTVPVRELSRHCDVILN